MTFLSVYTPTYRRPFQLELCKASVANQTVPVDHVIVEDKIGIGVDGMFADIPNHAHKPVGDYVMVLSDDNVLTDGSFAEQLQEVATETDVDVVVFKGRIDTTIQPAAWSCEPIETMIDLSCFAVKRHVWIQHAGDWGHRYEGDFDFIHTLWAAGRSFYWWDRMAFMALQISRGASE